MVQTDRDERASINAQRLRKSEKVTLSAVYVIFLLYTSYNRNSRVKGILG